MAQLRTELRDEGFSQVQTYLQSGNVVLSSELPHADDVSQAVAEVIAREFGVKTSVIVRSPDQMKAIRDWDPFPALALTNPALVHVIHLDGEPDQLGLDSLLAADWGADQITINGSEIAIGYGESMHTSRLQHAAILRQLKVDGTARNWRTVLALAEMCSDA